MLHGCCMLRDALMPAASANTRNGLDVKPLLSHSGLECIAAVIDSHMRHQGTPLRACAAGLLVCLFAKCRGSPHSPWGVSRALNVSCNVLSVCIGSLCGSPATALQECCGWR
jgi:hypothetical protein